MHFSMSGSISLSLCLFVVGTIIVSGSLCGGYIHGAPSAFFHTFTPSKRHNLALLVSNVNTPPQGVTNADADNDDGNGNDDEESMTDEEILKNTPISQLETLCSRLKLSTEGSKSTLLKRLRNLANERSELERKRQLERRARVEAGTGNEKERYEIIDEEDYLDFDEEEEGFLFIDFGTQTATNGTLESKTTPIPPKTYDSTKQNPILTAPSPDLVDRNENGEKVVTVYSTKDQNDLTGIAAAQPGQAASKDPMISGVEGNGNAPWDSNHLQKARTSSKELESIKSNLEELVQGLLAMSGAPAFQDDFDDTAHQLGAGGALRRPSYGCPEGYIGFDPAKVPSDMLSGASKALRANRGKLLQEVLREFELRAVGYDGTAGDDKERGGGHYNEVAKVGAFLEGVRRTEVSRIARDTVTILLGKIVTDGIQGIDLTLATMTRSGDDASDDVGELNDTLLDYLNDAVRQQERKVEQLGTKNSENILESSSGDDRIEDLWRVDEEDGQRVETFNLNDPKVKTILKQEFENSREAFSVPRPRIPQSPPEKLLLLLKMLRDRIKTEALFAHDDKARNLRILAYCLHAETDEDRTKLLEKELGSSFDRLDSLVELVSSSIEYGESTSHQLHPSKSRPLNVSLLRRILELTMDLRKRWQKKASGANGGKPRLLP